MNQARRHDVLPRRPTQDEEDAMLTLEPLTAALGVPKVYDAIEELLARAAKATP